MLVSSDGTEKANGESCLVVSKTSVNGIYIYIRDCKYRGMELEKLVAPHE